ncbi:MAG: TonB-dependent receptor [Deltaproteobacteria bacterium]|nr:TonB-dependent receptor [Deltaproteobacteria bacterium]
MLPRLAPLLLLVASTAPALAQEAAAPTLAAGPQLQELVEPELPEGTAFPEGADSVTVVLTIDVDETGAVQGVAVKEGAGEPFDGAARSAAGRFVFEPARLTDGRTVPVKIAFRMTIAAPPPPPAPEPEPVRYQLTLLERGTRVPLARLRVLAVKEGEQLAEGLTDAAGVALLTVDATEFTLVALPPEHQKLEVSITAEAGESRDETIYLQRTTGAYSTVVRAQRVRREVTRRVLSKAEVEKLPGTSGDTIKVIENLPGVARPSFSGGDIILRGASPGDSRVFLEGLEIPSVYHFGGLRSTFGSKFLETVDFVPGNYSAEYGRATGGIIDVKVRDPATDLFRGRVDLNAYDASFALEGPVTDTLSIGGGFARSYIDTLLPLALPDSAPVAFDTAPRFYDYQLIASYRPAKGHQLRLLFFGSMDRLQLLFEEPTSDPTVRGALSTRSMFHQLMLTSRSRLSSSWSEETSVRVGLQEVGFSLGQDFAFDLGLRDLSWRSTFTFRPSERFELAGGLDGRWGRVKLALSSPRPPKEGEGSVPTATQDLITFESTSIVYEPATFLEARLRPIDGLTLTPGLRLDYYGPIEGWALDPRLSAIVDLGERTSLRAGAGLYQQQPFYDESAPNVGNPELLPERSFQASAGIAHRLPLGPDASLEVDVTGFYKKLDRLVSRNLSFGFTADEPPYLSQGTGRIFGAELLARARLGDRFVGWLAYTYQRSLRTDRPGAAERRFDFDQPHILTAVASWELPHGFTVGARFRLVSGNPTTPVVSSIFDAAAGVYVPVYGDVNSERLPAFHQLDLRVDRTWVFPRWKFSAYLDVQNAYAHGNVEGTRYSYDYAQSEALTGLPILPVFGVKGEW